MRRRYLAYTLLFMMLLSISCSTFLEMVATPTPTYKPTHTFTATFTETPTPTFTLPPTLTPTLAATATPTFTPTQTQVSYGAAGVLYWVAQDNYTGDPDFDGTFYSIGILDLETGENSILLESDGETYSLYLSSVDPNGRYVYFSASEFFELNGEIISNSLIYAYDLLADDISQVSVPPQYSGSQPVEELLNEGWPDISPDGRYMVFGSNRDNLEAATYVEYLYLMDLDDFSIVEVPGAQANALRARFSPDGNFLAYSFWDGDDWEIYVISLDGTVGFQVTDNEATDRYPEWSPDGDELVFHSDRDGDYDLYFYDLNSGETRQFTSSPGSEVTASWSPNGDFMIYMSGSSDYDINIYDFSTGEEQVLIDLDETVGAPVWVP